MSTWPNLGDTVWRAARDSDGNIVRGRCVDRWMRSQDEWLHLIETGGARGVAVTSICSMAHSLGITGEELERAIEIKHAHNRTRKHRHGGKRL